MAHVAGQYHGFELLELLRISMPTPRGQEAQLDQVVETHRIAREARIDYASRKEEDDQDQFSSCVSTYLGLNLVGDAATGRAKALLLKDLLMGLAVLGGPGGVLGWVMNESFGCVERRPRWRKTALRVQAPRASWPNRYLPREKGEIIHRFVPPSP